MNNTSGMFEIVPCTFAGDSSAAIADECITNMDDSVRAIEQLLNYRFNDKKLLEEALTHPSYTDSPSYQRLEFVGDAALGIPISNFFFLAYPDLLPGQLSLLRSANVSTEKLARAAVRHGLYKYVRRNAAALDEKVRDFTLAVRPEADTVVYGGTVKAPKVLADIVESVAAAVYVDCQFDLQAFWIFRGILEPIVTLDVLQQQRQPVTMLFEFCQKERKQVNIKYRRRRKKNIARVYVEGKFIASSSCEQKENAKFQAAKAALEKLSHSNSEDKMNVDIYISMNGTNEIEGAKQKLHEICGKKRWPKPTYQKEFVFTELNFLQLLMWFGIVRKEGPSHERKFLCSVQVETVKRMLFAEGDEKSKVKDAENSAASSLIYDRGGCTSMVVCSVVEGKIVVILKPEDWFLVSTEPVPFVAGFLHPHKEIGC
ncbi:unnamed protein product [Camellia sinensis]